MIHKFLFQNLHLTFKFPFMVCEDIFKETIYHKKMIKLTWILHIIITCCVFKLDKYVFFDSKYIYPILYFLVSEKW